MTLHYCTNLLFNIIISTDRSGHFKCLYRGILLYLLHFYCYTQGRIFLDKDIFNVKETFHMDK